MATKKELLEEIEKLKAELKAEQDRRSQAEQENRTLKEDNQRLQIKCDCLQEEVSRQKAINDTIADIKTLLIDEVAELKQSIVKADKTNTDLSNKLADTEKKNEKLQEQINQKNLELIASTNTINDLQNQIKDMEQMTKPLKVGRKTEVTEALKEQIQTLYQSGESMRSIAKQTNKSVAFIHKVIHS